MAKEKFRVYCRGRGEISRAARDGEGNRQASVVIYLGRLNKREISGIGNNGSLPPL